MCFPLNKCCYCITLNTGTKFIAVLSLVCSVLTVMVYAGAAMTLPAAAQTKHTFYLGVAATAGCRIVFCCLLLYGAFWSKPSYLWPWLVASWISCGIMVPISLLGVVLLSIQYYEDVETANEISTMSTFYFVYAGIIYYCAVIVKSRRMQMLRAEETESADKLMRRPYIAKSLLV